MTIASYCRRPACVAAPRETLLSAARRMEKQGVGLLVVTEGGRLRGVLTDRDVALHVAAEGHAASAARVEDAMSGDPVAVDGDAPLEEALHRMRRRRVRRLPVLDADQQVEGLVSADDLLRLLSREIGGLGEVLAAQLPSGASRAVGREAPRQPPRRTAEHHAREVVTRASAASIAEVARCMEEHAVGSVVVCGDDVAVGIVTDRDIALRVVAAELDPRETSASAVMSAPLIVAEPTDPVEEIVSRMRTASVRRMPVVRDERPVGIVTFDDLLVGLGRELGQLSSCVEDEIWSAGIQGYSERLRHELESRFEEAASQLWRLGDQTLRTLGGELEGVAERVAGSLRRIGSTAEERELRVVDLMQPDVRTCTPDAALSEPARIMWERDCGCVPVVARDGSGRVVGIITDRDVCMASYTRGGRLAELRVDEAMSRGVHACRPEATLAEAEALMRANQVRRVPVVDDAGRLRGILSLADLAEGASGRRERARGVDETELAHTLEAICRPRHDFVRAD